MSHEALIARLEALTGPDRLSDANILWSVDPEAFKSDEGDDADHLKPSYCYGRGGWTMNRADRAHLDRIPVPRLTASLDAAVALVERVLPGCDICLQDIHADFRDGEARHIAEVMHNLQWVMDEGFPEPTYLTKGSGQSNSRPIALLIATMKALPNKDEANG